MYNNKKIGLLGLTFASPNKGCMALSYVFLEILNEIISDEKFDIIVFSNYHYDIHDEQIIKSIELFNFSYKKPRSIKAFWEKIKECDIVFDFTEGDSFSDIYGFKRMLLVSLNKLLVIKSKTPLFLGPQTYGPYKYKKSKWLAKYIINNCFYCCSRDEQSTMLVSKLSNNQVYTYTDIAFALQPVLSSPIISDRIKVGINISALLWNGGYKKNNQFNLSVDYKEYTNKIIRYLLKDNLYEVHLIPHVYAEEMNYVENDYIVATEIKKEFQKCIIAPMYINPTEVKGYIACMDIFIGARMHSTIAAFSMGVATIPFSYSKKFEGLYNSLEYPYVINGKLSDTNDAVNHTIEYIKDYLKLKESQQYANQKVEQKLQQFKALLKKILN